MLDYKLYFSKLMTHQSGPLVLPVWCLIVNIGSKLTMDLLPNASFSERAKIWIQTAAV